MDAFEALTVLLAEFEKTMKDERINSKAKKVATIAQVRFRLPIFSLQRFTCDPVKHELLLKPYSA